MSNTELQPLKTINNTPIVGVKKAASGSLVVDDLNAYNKYKREKQLLQRVTKLEEQVAILMAQLQNKEQR